MSQSLSKIYLHIIFHIKNASPSIKEEHLERVHSYIGQLVNTTGCQTLIVGGVSNHVHIVCQLSKNETVSHLLEEVKRNSSRWIKTIDDRYRHFAWQGGYAAFSISESVLPKAKPKTNNGRRGIASFIQGVALDYWLLAFQAVHKKCNTSCFVPPAPSSLASWTRTKPRKKPRFGRFTTSIVALETRSRFGCSGYFID